jgi:hypothetical protein
MNVTTTERKSVRKASYPMGWAALFKCSLQVPPEIHALMKDAHN